jgi:hypothetical protein
MAEGTCFQISPPPASTAISIEPDRSTSRGELHQARPIEGDLDGALEILTRGRAESMRLAKLTEAPTIWELMVRLVETAPNSRKNRRQSERRRPTQLAVPLGISLGSDRKLPNAERCRPK